MKDLLKLAAVLRALGFAAHVEISDDNDCSLGDCVVEKDNNAWFVWAMKSGGYEVQMYDDRGCIYDGVMRDSLLEVVTVIGSGIIEE